MKLSAPYRFVPAAEEIHAPGWGAFMETEAASVGPHDIPYEDGISGEITLRVTALTPLFIGAEKQEGGETGSTVKPRFEVDGSPAIPGTGLKGAIRSVIEAASSGNLRDRIDDRRYSIRDLTNKEDYLDHMTDMFRPLSRAGWLSRDGGTWIITPCHWSLVRQKDLETYHEKAQGRRARIGHRRETAGQKYAGWKAPLALTFSPGPVSTEGSFANGRELSRAGSLGTGPTEGHIVFTGQPQPNTNRNAKSTEFIFHGRDGTPFEVATDKRRDFESIHRNPNTGQPNEEWGYWLEQGGRVPIFWLEDDAGGLRAFGLAMMFRLAYAKSTREAAPDAFDRRTNGVRPVDLADLIFGRVPEGRDDGPNRKEQSLKGRASFTLMRRTHAVPDPDPTDQVLLAPKPGFYPAYIRQEAHEKTGGILNTPSFSKGHGGRNKGYTYTTYHHPSARIRGFKRYPVGREAVQQNIPAKVGSRRDANTKTQTRVHPVGAGSVFEGRLRVFNLRRAELGALVWALTWGGRPETHAHRMGGGKPLNFGTCRIDILTDDAHTALLPNDAYRAYTDHDAATLLAEAEATFVAHMEAHVSGWAQSEPIRELLATADLSRGRAMETDGTLAGMNDPKDFQQAKKDGLILPLPSGPTAIEEASRPLAAGMNRPNTARASSTRPIPGLRYREGQTVLLDGMEVRIVSNVKDSDTTAMVDIDGDIEEVGIDELTSLGI